jgi:hypothetical protein
MVGVEQSDWLAAGSARPIRKSPRLLARLLLATTLSCPCLAARSNQLSCVVISGIVSGFELQSEISRCVQCYFQRQRKPSMGRAWDIGAVLSALSSYLENTGRAGNPVAGDPSN